jgi:hypothetical protein
VFHRINKAQPATWRDPNTIQIGLGEKSVSITDLSLAQQQIVEALYSGVVEGQQDVLDETFKASIGTTNSLIEKLSPVMELQGSTSNSFGAWQELAFAELARAALDYEVNPEMVMAERFQRVVHLDQIDKAGALLAKALLASGVGKVVTHDDGKVLKTDLGELGFSSQELGHSRFESLTQELLKLSLPRNVSYRFIDLNYKPSKDLAISFAVTSGHLVTRPSTYLRWLNRDVPHLNINFDMYEAQISPIVFPGVTPCLNCLAEHKVDDDPAWPAIASQLIDLPRTRDDSSSLLTAIGLALRTILRQLDKSAGFTISIDSDSRFQEGYVLDYATGDVRRTKYSFHKLCNCRSLDEF